MADGWVRSTFTNPNNFGFFGRERAIVVQPGQTVLRSWWNIGMYYLAADITTYPPGASCLRVGMAWINFDETPAVNVTPITDASADWMAITVLNPTVVQLSRATNVAWQINWGFQIDQSVKSMRKNTSTDNYGLQVAWEFALEDETPGFTIPGWWGNVDALVRTP